MEFSGRVCGDERVRKALEMLEVRCRTPPSPQLLVHSPPHPQQHDALDPNVLLLCLWLPWARQGVSRLSIEVCTEHGDHCCAFLPATHSVLEMQNVKAFVDVGNRWRPRVYGALRVAHASMKVRRWSGHADAAPRSPPLTPACIAPG